MASAHVGDPRGRATLRRLGYALGRWLATRHPGRKLPISRRTRPGVSGSAILAAVAEGLLALGTKSPTSASSHPAVPFALLERKAGFGLMITPRTTPLRHGVKLSTNAASSSTPRELEIELARPGAGHPPPLPVIFLPTAAPSNLLPLPPRAL